MTDRKAIEQAALEAAARAIENGSAEEWEALPLIHKLVFRSQAKAAIAAYLATMREAGPCAGEVDAVAKVLRQEGFAGDAYSTARKAIRAMIAAGEV